MNFKFSDRMSALEPSAVREILKLTADPSIIAFSAGNPSPDTFPTDEIAKIAHDILTENPTAALQYSFTEGYPPLREACKRLATSRYGISMEQNELMILSGAQQGADLVTKALINEGDTVLCEDPSFVGCLNCFRSYHCNLVGIEMQEDGMNLEKLEEAMKTQPNVKMLYIIPNFQNPSGITTSLEKRKAILALAKKYDVVVLEDNPYGDLRYTGTPVDAIKSLDDEGRVVYIGSFSKIFSPGMRVGFLIADPQLIQKMVVGKQCSDVHTNILAQMICERWLMQYDLEAHLEKVTSLYRKKCNLMLDCIQKEFSPAVTHTTPDGGLFVWCTLPEDADMLDFVKQAIAQKAAVVPGNAFLADPNTPCRSFRMNFSTPSDEKIIRGVEIIGKLTKKLY